MSDIQHRRAIRDVLLALLLMGFLLWFFGCTQTPPQSAGTIRDVAGDLSQTIRQQTGMPPDMIAELAVCLVGWAVGLGLLGWLLPNPKTLPGKVLVLTLILFFVVVLPVIFFVLGGTSWAG